MFAFDKRTGIGFVIAVSLCRILISESSASETSFEYCSSGARRERPKRVPEWLAPQVAKTFGISVRLARDGAWVRCAGKKLQACWVGANLNCGKVNTRRSLPGATAFCRTNPNSEIVPMAATGHDTIYEWRCVGARAVAGKAVVAVDAFGYAAGNWRELP